MSILLAAFQPVADSSPKPLSPPDEISRLKVPMYVYNHGTIPTGLEDELRIDPYGYSYGLYNAGPYLLQGIAMRLFGHINDSDRALLIYGRLINVFLGLIMAIIVYRLGKIIFRDDRYRWMFCFGVTFLPQALFLHTYINTDSCAMLSTAIIVYAWLTAEKEGYDIKNSLRLSLGIILCALSYYNAYGYILCSVILFLGYYLKKEEGKTTYDYKPMLKRGVLIAAVALLGAGWWFVRAYIVLDGDFIGLATAARLKETYGAGLLSADMTYKSRGVSLLTMFKENHFFACVIQSFIAAYGSVCILTYGFVYHFYRLFFVLGMLGCIGHIWTERKNLKFSYGRILFHANMAVCIILPMVLLIHYAYAMDYQAQGRYIMPALIPFMYYVVKGFEHGEELKIFSGKTMKRLYRLGTFLVPVVMVISCVATVIFKALPLYLH